jgi:hypothetical protein
VQLQTHTHSHAARAIELRFSSDFSSATYFQLLHLHPALARQIFAQEEKKKIKFLCISNFHRILKIVFPPTSCQVNGTLGVEVTPSHLIIGSSSSSSSNSTTN